MRIDLAAVAGLYRTHADDLAAVVGEQRRLLADRPAMVPQLDDLEAEITYLLLRAARPERVMELGTFHGWSTTWILRALRDNGRGHLHSFDRVDHVRSTVPAGLAEGRWTFVPGDVRQHLAAVPGELGYLFVDADHGGRFGRWCTAHLFPLVPAGVPVSVHDVFHLPRPVPFSEGAVVTRWLARRDTAYFTAARRRERSVFDELVALRTELGVAGVRDTTTNPMLWFTMPS